MMRDTDLVIRSSGSEYAVRVTGRANFEYAVPLREIARSGVVFESFRIDLRGCIAMDSTFMGVLSMLALTMRRTGRALELLNASEVLKKLLRDLGVAKLFEFKDGELPVWEEGVSRSGASSLEKVQTVLEAHRTLIEADSANAQRFAQVVEYAAEDEKRLRENGERQIP